MDQDNNKTEQLWDKFRIKRHLSEEQIVLFKKYADMLIEWGKQINLTAIQSIKGIINRHFSDSLILADLMDLTKPQLIADVGTGAGLPGIALKIVYPHLKIILIEVNHKKRQFLSRVIQELELENIEVCDLDFRTFIRTTTAPIDFFVARASLEPLELCRLFRGGCEYKNTTLVYWAIEEFVPNEKIKDYIVQQHSYVNDGRKRKLLVFRRQNIVDVSK